MPTPAVTTTPPLLRAAIVRRAHGVRGELRVEPLGGDARRFVAGLRLRVEADGRMLTVAAARGLADGDVLLRLEGVGTREAADALRDAYLCVERADLRGLAEDEWFVFELVGLQARTSRGEVVGTVDDVEHYTEHDTLVVRDGHGRISRFPLVRAFVTSVDIAAGEVVVTPWPEEDDRA
jgi:16S rRNA processing protein RimM